MGGQYKEDAEHVQQPGQRVQEVKIARRICKVRKSN